jgi:hypothetical protein
MSDGNAGDRGRAVAALADEVITRLYASDPPGRGHRYDGAFLYDDAVFGEEFERQSPLTFVGAWDDDVPGEWSVSLTHAIHGDSSGRFQANRVRMLSPAESRRFVTKKRGLRWSPLDGRIAEVSVSEFGLNGKADLRIAWVVCPHETDRVRTLYVDGSRVTKIGENTGYHLPIDPERVGHLVQLLRGMAFLLPAWWTVGFRIGDSPRVRLHTDAVGVAETFRFRDLPDGRKRRAALLHWVADHWRADRRDTEAEVYVRKHLRGSTGFRYGDLACDVSASAEDAEAVRQAMRDRAAMRKAGTDRRVRRR